MTEGQQAAIYCRVSTDDQARGASLPAQERLCRERAESEGYDVANVYSDVLSGSRSDRPEYQRLLADAAAGEFEAVFCWKYDRLGRDAEELLRARRMLEAAGVRLVSTTEGEAESTLVYGVRALVAQEEREKISERTRMGLREVARSGRYPCGQPPLGYRATGTRKEAVWHVDEQEAAIVHRIDSLFLGGMGAHSIARTLNEEGFRTRRGKLFCARVILDLLDNPTHVGLIKLKDELFEGKHPPIRDEETWRAIQSLRRAKRESASGGRGHHALKGLHLLTRGLLRCGRCGRAMTAKTNPESAGSWQHYRCSLRHTTGGCDMPSIARHLVDDAVIWHFERAIFSPELTIAALAEAAERKIGKARALAAAADAEAAGAEAGRERADRAFLEGRIDAESYERLLARTDGEREAAEAETERLREQVALAEHEAGLLDAGQEVAERWAAIKGAIAGRIQDVDGIERLRVELTSTFEAVTLRTTEEGFALTFTVRDEAIASWLEPVESEPGTTAWRVKPTHRKAALRLDPTGEPSAPSPPGMPCRGGPRC